VIVHVQLLRRGEPRESFGAPRTRRRYPAQRNDCALGPDVRWSERTTIQRPVWDGHCIVLPFAQPLVEQPDVRRNTHRRARETPGAARTLASEREPDGLDFSHHQVRTCLGFQRMVR
jgi:hypothetical protein